MGGLLREESEEVVYPCPRNTPAPHMFCPSRRDFYSRLSLSNVLDSFSGTVQEIADSVKTAFQEAAVTPRDGRHGSACHIFSY